MGVFDFITGTVAIIIIVIILLFMYRHRVSSNAIPKIKIRTNRFGGWLANGTYVNYYTT